MDLTEDVQSEELVNVRSTSTPPRMRMRTGGEQVTPTLKEQRINQRVENWRRRREELVNERRNLSREEETDSADDTDDSQQRE